MNQTYTRAERAHLARVKAQPCSVCDEPGPSEAHHIHQSHPWTCIALCVECHRGPQGWHGTRARWKLRKVMDEETALNTTLERLALEVV